MDLKIGLSASITKAFTEQDVSLFADLSLDKNKRLREKLLKSDFDHMTL